MTAIDSVKNRLDEYERLIKLQMQKIEELVAENERLNGLDAHSTLQSIYRNPASPEGNRIKAATAALPVEKPKLMSVVPALEDRQERWRAYQRFALQKQILEETHQLPAPGWDAHLVEGVYEAPAEGEPPMDLYGRDAIKAHVVISELMAHNRRIRNGNDDSGDSGD